MKLRKLAVLAGLFLLFGLIFQVHATAAAEVSQRLQTARELEDARDYSEAFSDYNELFQTAADNVRVVRGLLRTAIELERWPEATRALKQHERLAPESSIGPRHGARLYFYRDQLDTALQWAEKFQRRRPGDWRPFHFKFRMHLERRDYVNARSALRSAMVREDDNPWVMLDNLQLKLLQRDQFDEQLFGRLRDRAEHPKIYRTLSSLDAVQQDPQLVRELLEEGLSYFPASRPPLMPRTSLPDYRYDLALVQYRLGDEQAARNSLQPVDAGPEFRWFRILLRPDPERRLEELTELLADYPDNLIYQWYYSGLVREREGLEGDRRRGSADYFYREYRTLDFYDYTGAAFSALNRSLEMYPLASERQFELARFYGRLGWERSQLNAARRASELGYTPETRITDYLETIDIDTPADFPGPERPRVRGVVSFNSFFAAPPGGRRVLVSMLNQIFHHHPAFELTGVELEAEVDERLARQVRETDLDGAFRLTVKHWEQDLEADVRYFYPRQEQAEVSFFDSREVKLWRLLNVALEAARDNWPWQGRVFSVRRGGAGVNLGKIHGVSTGDTVGVDDWKFSVSEVSERFMELEFPSPVFSSRIERGSIASLIQRTEGE